MDLRHGGILEVFKDARLDIVEQTLRCRRIRKNVFHVKDCLLKVIPKQW